MLTRSVSFALFLTALLSQGRAVEPKLLTGHSEPAYAGVYSPDGTRLVTGSFDKTLRIWDLNSATSLRTLSGHTGLVLCVAMSKDGTRLASGSLDNTVRMWDMPNPKPTAAYQPHQGSACLAMSPDGTQWLTGGADKMLRLWNAADRQLVKEIGPLPHPIVRVAFRADKAQIAAADTAGFVRLFNPTDGAPQGDFGAHGAEITGLAYAANNTWVMTTGADGLVKRWSVQAPSIRSATGHEQPILALRMNAAGTVVATGSADKTCRLWQNGTQQLIRQLEGHSGPVTSLCFQFDGARIVTGCADKIARLFDVSTGTLVKAYPEQAAEITAVAVHPNNQEIAVADASGSIKIWKADEGIEIRSLPGHVGGTLALAYSVNPPQLISGGVDKRVRVWNTADGTQAKELDASDVVRSVAVSWDHLRVAAGCDDKNIPIWNLEDGNPVATYGGHTAKITSLEYSRDNLNLLSSSADGTVRGWNTKLGRQTQHATSVGGGAINGIGWSNDNQTFAFSGDDKAVYWGQLAIQYLHAADDKRVNALVVHPNSTQCLTAGDDGIVKLWDVANGNLIRELKGHEGAVRSIAISPNQQQIASGGSDKKLKIWNANDSKLQYNIATTSEVVQIAFSSDQKKLIAAGSDHLIRGFDPVPLNPQPSVPPSQEPAQVADGHPTAITGLAFFSDSRAAVSAAADGSVRTWSIAAAQSTLSLPGHTSQVYGVAFHPTLPLIASASNDKTVKIWDFEQNKNIRSFAAQGAAIYSLAMTPDGMHVVTAGGDKTVRAFKLDDGSQVRQFSGPVESAYSVAVSPNGQQVAAVGLDRKVFIWSFDIPTPVKTLAGHKDDLYKVEFNSAGNRLLTVGYAGNVSIWDPNHEKPLFQQKLPAILYSGAYSPSGKQIALFANDGKVYLLDLPAEAH